MSTGHKGANSTRAMSAQELDAILARPDIQQQLHSPKNVDRTYDIPYLAGYSVDDKTIYIDRHLPNPLPIKGRPVDVTPFLVAHESLEKAAIDIFGWTYSHAHQAATHYERRLTLQAGVNWKEYSDALEPFIKADEHERLQLVPPNLDVTPYDDDPTLLKHMQQVVHANLANQGP